MANILKWRKEWTLRIETLDEDHQRLVDLLTEIARCFSEGPSDSGPQVVGDQADCWDGDLYAALDQLGAHAREHFRREEEFMRTIDYSAVGDHRSEHALLMAEYTQMVRNLREGEVRLLDAESLKSLKDWVVAHVLGTDRGFADHYFRICRGETDAR